MQAGVQQRVCASCSLMETAEMPLSDHVFSDWNTVSASTCTAQGQRERLCSLCGAAQQENLPLARHQYGLWVNDDRADCTVYGTRHRTCVHCDKLETGPLAPRYHAYDKWEVRSESTCLQPGIRARNCKYCQHIEEEALPQKAHLAASWQVITQAALHRPGERSRSCKNCDTVLETRSYYPGDEAFAVSFCVMGLPVDDLVPDVSEKGYRAALLDTTEDRTLVLPLIAADAYCVGEVHIKIRQGSISASYLLYSTKSRVFKERMQLLEPGTQLTQEIILSNRQGLKVSGEQELFHKLQNLGHVLIYLRFDGIFDFNDPLNEKINWQDEKWQAYAADLQAQADTARELFR